MSSDGFITLFRSIPGETNPHTLTSPLYLPGLVGDVSYSEDAGHQEYDTVRRGQFSQPEGGRGLNIARKLSAITVTVYTTWAEVDWLPSPSPQDPDDVRHAVYDLLHARRAFYALMRRPGMRTPEFNTPVTLRTVTPTVKQGEAAARYLELQLKSWRDPTVDARSSQRSRKKGKTLPTTHKLTAADSLTTLSQEYYGTPNGWRTIAAENGVTTWGSKTPLAGDAGTPFLVGDFVRIPLKPASLSGGKRPRA